MSYLPHTQSECRDMLKAVGVGSEEELFGDVPESVRYPEIDLPEPLSELEILRELRRLGDCNADLDHLSCFLGAGAYNHFVPSVVAQITGRSEFYTAYTPYQPEISQGTLQAMFEYQTMMCALTGMDVANASHYDGATAVAEAIIMCVDITRRRRNKVVVARTVHPEYRATARSYTRGMGIGVVGDENIYEDVESILELVDDDTACLILQSPDFLGRMRDLSGLADRVHERGALLVVVVDPISLGLFVPPGSLGADIVVGEGQALGNDLNYGGPYLGFFACRQKHVRKLAGRLVGETVDVDGKRGYVLTLSTREQHIRRERATSNICTNQSLCALAAAVYLAALGKCGLRSVAELCYHKAHYAAEVIDAIPGFELVTEGPFFKEFVVRCPRPVAELNDWLLGRGIVGGYDLSRQYPELEDHALLCVTEMNTRDQIDTLAQLLREAA